jgi:hypothetical protein
MFRSYATPDADGRLVIADRAFAWQGRYTIGVKSRIRGDYHTVSPPSYHAVVIDSVAPRILVDDAPGCSHDERFQDNGHR